MIGLPSMDPCWQHKHHYAGKEREMCSYIRSWEMLGWWKRGWGRNKADDFLHARKSWLTVGAGIGIGVGVGIGIGVGVGNGLLHGDQRQVHLC